MTYTEWLRSLGPDLLAELLRLRPDAADRPMPMSLDELATRLTTGHSARNALADLDAVAVQVAEIIAAAGPIPASRLREWLGESEVLTTALARLRRRGLIWTDGSAPETLKAAGGLRSCWARPLNLGPGIKRLLGQLPPDQLDLVTRTLGVGRRSSRKKAHQAIADHLTPQRIAALLAEAPPTIAPVLAKVAWDGSDVDMDASAAATLALAGRYGDSSGIGWAVGHALLLPVYWNRLAMPAEIALAIRGADWHPTVRIERPEVDTTAVQTAAVERESAAAATSMLDTVTSVLDVLAHTPAVPLRTGGLGVREIRRLAKATSADERLVVLALEIASAARLVAGTDAGVLPAAVFDQWRTDQPGQRIGTLLHAWWSHPGAMSERATADADKSVPVLVHRTAPEVQQLRWALLARGTELGPDTGVRTLPSLVADVVWQRPMRYQAIDVDAQAAACWWEAEAFGLVAHGAVTRLGRALLSGTHVMVADELLPAAAARATFQADLTAVVSGSPSAGLADLLDAAADRETRGSAHVWRFTAASVRRFLDGGGPAEGLLTDLAAAANQPLPQPLEYLIRDVARRHGEVTVRTVSCCVVSADEPLLAEIAAHRALRGLGLHLLAPTVLASGKPIGPTLDALRAAGYAPVRLSAAGNPVVDRDPPRRAEAPVPTSTTSVTDVTRHRPVRPAQISPDPAELARRLLRSPDSTAAPTTESLTFRRLADARTGLVPAELRVLSHAIDHQEAVYIEYVDQNGKRTARKISDIALFGSVVEAWCHLRQAERMFSLGGIETVSPAE